MSRTERETNRSSILHHNAIWFLAALTCVQLLGYVSLLWLSEDFEFNVPGTERPLPAVLLLFLLLFSTYIASLIFAVRLKPNRQTIAFLFVSCLIFRGVILFSQPIQEVDIYRYIWDGAVANEGVSPFRYPPLEIRQAFDTPTDNPEITRLADRALDDPGLKECLQRVHYEQVSTVYPPVSQVVFRFGDLITPKGALTDVRVCVMKTLIVAFDMGVFAVLVLMLWQSGLPLGWSLAYGWCPLVIKEFANSGHLDSIAVALQIAAVFALVRSRHRLVVAASGALLGLAFGAKLFPLVLVPLLVVYVLRRDGWRDAIVWGTVFFLTAAASIWPMLHQHASAEVDRIENVEQRNDQLKGLKTFLARWEMNDLIFMVVEENVRPDDTVPGQPELWFVWMPNAFRKAVTDTITQSVTHDAERTPFFLTRFLMTIGFGLIVGYQCLRVWRDQSAIYEAAFLTLAWFWFLSPTQNPWYWIWALPLVPFARNRVWLLVSGVALIYYSRFWFEYHPVRAGAYLGVGVFDFIVVWIEFAPVLILLFVNGSKNRVVRWLKERVV